MQNPDCTGVAPGTVAESFANPSHCLQQLCSGFLAFLNRAFGHQGGGKRGRKAKSATTMRYGGIAKLHVTLTFEDIRRSLDQFRYRYARVDRQKGIAEAFGKDSDDLRFSMAAPFALQPSRDADTLQLVFRNKDELRAVAIIRKDAWHERGVITVCTRFPEDVEDNWTWDMFAFSWNKRDGWTCTSATDDVLSDLSKEIRNALQAHLNQIMDRM